jgi:Phage terminase large subunit
MSDNQLTMSEFQTKVLSVPENFDLFLGGGRGGAKSYTLALIALRHVAQYGENARIMYLRQSHMGVADFELICRTLFATVYGTDARYNGASGVWRFPGGGYMELNQLESHDQYAKHQGRSFTLLLLDEVTQYATPDLLDLMRSNLRGAKNIPIRVICAGNPGNRGHAWVAKRWVFRAKPWEPFYEEKSKREWVHAPSTFVDNPFINQQEYKSQLEASCPADPELLRAWLLGDWAIARGAFFSSCLDEARNCVGPFTEVPRDRYGERWQTWLSHDFGSSAPSCTQLMTKSPGGEISGKFYPRGSIVILDELAAYRRDDLSKGLGWTAKVCAEAIRSELCDKWKVAAQGCADDAIFARMGSSAGSISDEFAAAGVTFQQAKKGDRISGWQRMKRLLADAGKPDVPGLFISRSCEYFWATVPYLARDQRRVEDVDSSGPDHAADACRYGCLYERPAIGRLAGIGWAS